MVAKKLKKACDTRWLSFNSAIQSLYADLVAVLQTLKQLKQDPGQPAAYGLLKKINGPVPHTEACDSLVSKAVNMWKAAKKRKLPYDRPSTQPEANSETEAAIPTTVAQDMGTQTDATSTTELQNIRAQPRRGERPSLVPNTLLLLYTILLLLQFLMKTLFERKKNHFCHFVCVKFRELENYTGKLWGFFFFLEAHAKRQTFVSWTKFCKLKSCSFYTVQHVND